jgi:hypothetical protein
VGQLNYLIITRPDLVYVVYTPSQFIDKPRQPHLEVAHKVLKYIIQSLGQGIFLPSIGLLELQVFYDTD